MKILFFGRPNILNARELQFGKFFNLNRRLWLGHWLEGARRSRSGRKRLVRVATLRCVPSSVGIYLRLAQAIQIIVDGVFGIETEVLGVGANEPPIKHAARKLIELLPFNRLQHSRADLGYV